MKLGNFLTAGDRVALNAFSSSNLEVVYESSDESIAYVADGEVVFACAGEVTLKATQPGNYKFNAAEPIEKTLTIVKADPMLGVTVDEITYGQALSEAVIKEVMNVLSTAEFARYAPATDHAMDDLYTATTNLINNLEDQKI